MGYKYLQLNIQYRPITDMVPIQCASLGGPYTEAVQLLLCRQVRMCKFEPQASRHFNSVESPLSHSFARVAHLGDVPSHTIQSCYSFRGLPLASFCFYGSLNASSWDQPGPSKAIRASDRYPITPRTQRDGPGERDRGQEGEQGSDGDKARLSQGPKFLSVSLSALSNLQTALSVTDRFP